MTNRKRLLLGAVLALTVVVTVMLVRTFLADPSAAIFALRFHTPAFDSRAAARRLSEAVQFQTVSRDGAPPPAEALAAQRTWLEASYPAFVARSQRVLLGGGTIIYQWTGSEPTRPPIVLMAHQDVVPADNASAWRHPPFSGAIDRGTVWGRGAVDDKSSLLAIMEAAETLVRAGFTPRRGIILVFGHDEETAGSGARAAAAFLKARRVRPWFVLDEGSLAVSDYPVTGSPVALIGVSEKGYATVRLVARTKGGHSSTPPDETAVSAVARAVTRLADHPFPRHYDGPTRTMLEALAPHAPFPARLAIANAWLLSPVLKAQIGATPQGAAMLHSTLAPTMLQGSPKENALATEASATINIRIAPGQTSRDAIAHIRKSIGDLPIEIELVGGNREPSPVAPVDSASFRLVAGVTAGQFAMPIVPAPVVAATDSGFMRELTDEIYRFQPIELSLAETEMLHGVNERLEQRQLDRMVRFYQGIMMQASQYGSEQ